MTQQHNAPGTIEPRGGCGDSPTRRCEHGAQLDRMTESLATADQQLRTMRAQLGDAEAKLNSRDEALRATAQDRARLHARAVELEQKLDELHDHAGHAASSLVSTLPHVEQDEHGHWNSSDGQFLPRDADADWLQQRIGFLAAIYHRLRDKHEHAVQAPAQATAPQGPAKRERDSANESISRLTDERNRAAARARAAERERDAARAARDDAIDRAENAEADSAQKPAPIDRDQLRRVIKTHHPDDDEQVAALTDAVWALLHPHTADRLARELYAAACESEGIQLQSWADVPENVRRNYRAMDRRARQVLAQGARHE